MDGDQLVIKCLLKLTMWNCILLNVCIFIIIKNKLEIKNISKNKELYCIFYTQARLKWLKGLCKKANEKDAEKLVDHMEKAEEKNEGNQLAQ